MFIYGEEKREIKERLDNIFPMTYSISCLIEYKI